MTTHIERIAATRAAGDGDFFKAELLADGARAAAEQAERYAYAAQALGDAAVAAESARHAKQAEFFARAINAMAERQADGAEGWDNLREAADAYARIAARAAESAGGL